MVAVEVKILFLLRTEKESGLSPVALSISQRELLQLEDKFRRAMVSNAQLDNEKQLLKYQVDVLTDELTESVELSTEVQRELKDRTKVESEFILRIYQNSFDVDESIIVAALKPMCCAFRLHCLGYYAVQYHAVYQTKNKRRRRPKNVRYSTEFTLSSLL